MKTRLMKTRLGPGRRATFFYSAVKIIRGRRLFVFSFSFCHFSAAEPLTLNPLNQQVCEQKSSELRGFEGISYYTYEDHISVVWSEHI